MFWNGKIGVSGVNQADRGLKEGAIDRSRIDPNRMTKPESLILYIKEL